MKFKSTKIPRTHKGIPRIVEIFLFSLFYFTLKMLLLDYKIALKGRLQLKRYNGVPLLIGIIGKSRSYLHVTAVTVESEGN